MQAVLRLWPSSRRLVPLGPMSCRRRCNASLTEPADNGAGPHRQVCKRYSDAASRTLVECSEASPTRDALEAHRVQAPSQARFTVSHAGVRRPDIRIGGPSRADLDPQEDIKAI